MNNFNQTTAPGWVVARLRRKLRQALSEQEELRVRLAIRARQVVELTREKNRAESVCEFWENQANDHFNNLCAAHQTIGGLRYYLKQAGVTIPDHLK